MKNLFLLLLFPAFFAGAQHYAWQPDFNAQVTVLTPLPNGRWLLGGAVSGTGWLFSRGYMAETTPDGDYLSSNEANLIDRTVIRAIIPLPDGRRVSGGISHGCDVTLGGFIQLQDSAGEAIWTKKYDPSQSPPFLVPAITAMLLTPGQEILAAGEDKIWRLELETGLLLEEKQLAGEEITDLVYTSDGKSYLFAVGKSIYGMDVDLNTTLLNTIPEAGKYYARVVAAPNNGFFALRNDNKILYRRWTGVGFNWITIDPAFDINDIETTGNGAVLCGLKNGKGYVSDIIDTSAQLETIAFTLTQSDLIPQQIGLDPLSGAYMLAGVELHGPSPRTWDKVWVVSSGSQNFWIQSFQPDGSTQNTTADAALVELVAHKLPKAQPYDGQPWSLLKWLIYGDGEFSVRLKNIGAETLQSVHVLAGRYSVDDPGFCPSKQYINKRFEQLDLAPGADTLLYLGYVGYGYTETVMPWEICFWATVPNGQTDANHDNDYVCGEFNLVSADHEPEFAGISLYPNPAQDALYLQLNGEAPGLCRIFNAAGQLAAEQTPVSTPAGYTLDVSRLPAGFYWLKTERGQGRFVKM